MARRRSGLPRTDKYRKTDLVVIGVLWMSDVFDPWIFGWMNFTLTVLFGDDYGTKGNFPVYNAALIVVKCVACVILSVAADLRNRKAVVCFVGLCIASLTPVFGILVVITQDEWYALAALSAYSVFFMVTPVRYVLIFNQKRYPSKMQVRKIVAALEVMKSLSSFLFYVSEPDPKTFKVYGLIVRWVITLPLLVFMVTLMDVVRWQTALDDPKERTFRAATTAICQDVKTKPSDDPGSKRKRPTAVFQFTLFAILLLPVVTAIIANLAIEKHGRLVDGQLVAGPVENVKVIDYKLYAFMANIVAIPLIAALITLCKASMQTFAEYVLLACGHVFNAAVLIYLTVALVQSDFNRTPKNDTIRNTTREIERHGVAVFYILTCPGDRDTVIFVETPEKTYTLDRFNDHQEQVPINLTVPKISYTLQAKTDSNGTLIKLSSVIEHNKRFFYFLVAVDGSIQKFIELFGAETVRLQASPILLVGNGWTYTQNDTKYLPTFLLKPLSNALDETHLQMPEPLTMVSIPLPGAGRWNFSYSGTEQIRKENDGLHAVDTYMPFTEFLIIISEFRENRQLGMCMGRTPLTTFNLSEAVYKVITQEVLNPPVNALKGIAGAAISVGYLQFFWLECPLRFRTTLFSFVLIGEEIAGYIVDTAVNDVTIPIMMIITLTVCVLGAIHVIIGRIYESRYRRELWYKVPDARSV